ncbi:MAG TPA: molybdopterin molybdenumtransferase MoeA, partial [Caldimonas sp.]
MAEAAPVTPPATLQEIGSCVGGYDPKALPVAAAREFLQRLAPRLQAVEKLAIRSALGRVLAEDIVSPIDVPAQDNSAMDGYAFRAADLAVAGETELEVVGSGFAGGDVATAIGPGQCVRIMTGATMP